MAISIYNLNITPLPNLMGMMVREADFHEYNTLDLGPQFYADRFDRAVELVLSIQANVDQVMILADQIYPTQEFYKVNRTEMIHPCELDSFAPHTMYRETSALLLNSENPPDLFHKMLLASGLMYPVSGSNVKRISEYGNQSAGDWLTFMTNVGTAKATNWFDTEGGRPLQMSESSFGRMAVWAAPFTACLYTMDCRLNINYLFGRLPRMLLPNSKAPPRAFYSPTFAALIPEEPSFLYDEMFKAHCAFMALQYKTSYPNMKEGLYRVFADLAGKAVRESSPYGDVVRASFLSALGIPDDFDASDWAALEMDLRHSLCLQYSYV